MVNFAPSRIDLDLLLNLVAIKLEITPTQYKDAVEKYAAVGRWLGAPDSLLGRFDPRIYSQGSLRLGTTVKPRSHEEYDLDIVSEVGISDVSFHVLYEAHYTRLAEHGYYRTILERKNRCLRLNYAGQFHMDILPAIPDPSRGGTALLVPDHDAQGLKPSNPKGYAAWFDLRKTQDKVTYGYKASAEPLPPQGDPAIKASLQRAVQLIKRQRDQSVEDADRMSPSIVYTTLAGEAYGGQPSTTEAISRYLAYVSHLIETHPVTPFRVLNPSNDGEVLSERWESDRALYAAFKGQVTGFRATWMRLLGADGIPQIHHLLKELFGEEVATYAVSDYSTRMARAKDRGDFGVKPGSSSLYYGAGTSLGTAGSIQRIGRNSNFGASD